MSKFIIARSKTAKQTIAKWLNENNSESLDFITCMAQEFGNMEYVRYKHKSK